ncbi:MAG: hypothetical protein JKY22_09690 [Flavobacteriaceae bacterium]|nr:hypothetical protein [Flavobacteriaceae bacterium]
MNNLSRSLLGTQSSNKAMPKDYTLQVIEYKINGERLITGTTTMRIPLQQIFLRRMHAVTEALNNRFDKGVVFDYNESQKRFVITRAKEDSYVIRFREVTMSNNNAIYTYSNNGMFRNNKTFRADAMRCRDLKGYNPSFYEKLHDQIAPINKDDDYGTYDEKWRKWSQLTERLITNDILIENGFTRMITTTTELQTALELSLTEFTDKIHPATGFDPGTPEETTPDISELPSEPVIDLTLDTGLDPTIIATDLMANFPSTTLPVIVETLAAGHIPIGSEDISGQFATNFGSRKLMKLSIENMKADFQSVVSNQGTDLSFYIDGDWVNGTWVNSFMLDHHRRNSKNTHDDIVLFINLRKSLHNETGFTKLSIYLENQEYIPEFDPILTQYQSLVDVYFCARPTGINAMRI